MVPGTAYTGGGSLSDMDRTFSWRMAKDVIRKAFERTTFSATWDAAEGLIKAAYNRGVAVGARQRGGDAILTEIRAERARQDAKHGVQDHWPHEWLGVIQEELGEAAKEANDAVFVTTDDGVSPEERFARMRRELIEVAASAVAAVECMDRNGWGRDAQPLLESMSNG